VVATRHAAEYSYLIGSHETLTGLVGDLASEHASLVTVGSLRGLGASQGSSGSEKAKSGTAIDSL